MSRVVVFACPRSNLGQSKLPEGTHLHEVPCTGRVSVALLLAALARGADGVLVLGRHQESCRLRGAEDLAKDRARRANRAVRLVGLGSGRIRFRVAEPGPTGPQQTVEEYASAIESLGQCPLAHAAPPSLSTKETLATSVGILRWMLDQQTARPDGTFWLEENGQDEPSPDVALLAAGSMALLDTIAADLFKPISIGAAVGTATSTLTSLGISSVGVWLGSVNTKRAGVLREVPAVYTFCEEDTDNLLEAGVKAASLHELLSVHSAELPEPPVAAPVGCDGSKEQTSLLESLGYRPQDLGRDPLSDGLSISPEQRVKAENRLAEAERRGAPAILTMTPTSLAAWAMITRQGTWRSSRVLPVLPHQLAWFAIAGVPLSISDIGSLVATDYRSLSPKENP
ncbi:MAG: hydrogenase iron-sulfur subunit [Pseudomonadota bacterium]